MAIYHYINATGERIEARGSEVKRLAAEGTITPETIIEFPDGRKGLAKEVAGLTFPKNPFLSGDSEVVEAQHQLHAPVPLPKHENKMPVQVSGRIHRGHAITIIILLIAGLAYWIYSDYQKNIQRREDREREIQQEYERNVRENEQRYKDRLWDIEKEYRRRLY